MFRGSIGPAVWLACLLAIAAAAPADDDDNRKRPERPRPARQPRLAEPARQAPSRQSGPPPERRPQMDRRPQVHNPPPAAPAPPAPRNYPVMLPPAGRPDTHRGANNTEVRFHSDGQVRVMHSPNMTITRSSAGARTVVVQRPDRILVTHGAGNGYVQRPIVVQNTTFVQRTYVRNNVVVTRVYRPYSFRGTTLAVYTPVRYYPAPFYAWTWSPWRTPVRYTWAWYDDPWYGYYRGYFAPYPVYTSAGLWLTDYSIASTLQMAYLERAAEPRVAFSGPYAGDALRPDVKQAIADEVRWQIEFEQAEARQPQMPSYDGLPRAMTERRRHTFVVARGLDVPNLSMGGQDCPLSEGDVLRMDGPAPNADMVNVQVLASKSGSCRRGSTVAVAVADLVDMQNHLRETIDAGMEELRARQGQGGLPMLPANAGGIPVTASFASQLPPPDANAAGELRQQYNQAMQAEQQVVNEAPTRNPPATAPATPVGIYQGPPPAEPPPANPPPPGSR